MKKLIYVTYQTFPANTANSLQTISNITHIVKNDCEVDLYFPLREKSSSNDFLKLQDFYSISNTFNIFGLKHNYPHGKINIFKPFFYHISHYLWSKQTIKKYFKNNYEDVFLTRSDWIAYFLGKQGSNVTFEIHQTSKLRDFIIKKLSKFSNVKIIFLHENLKINYENIINNKNIVLHNGVDSSLFKNNTLKDREKIVFLGKITRFDKSRGVEKLIEIFNNDYIKENFTLDIIGCSEKEKEAISQLLHKHCLDKCIKTYEWLSRKDAIAKIQSASYGLLINSPDNSHSYLYTSPLKYFEYLYADLKVLAVDFPSHRDLPLSKYLNFFSLEKKESFVDALMQAKKTDVISKEELETITLDSRAANILNFIF